MKLPQTHQHSRWCLDLNILNLQGLTKFGNDYPSQLKKNKRVKKFKGLTEIKIKSHEKVDIMSKQKAGSKNRKARSGHI